MAHPRRTLVKKCFEVRSREEGTWLGEGGSRHKMPSPVLRWLLGLRLESGGPGEITPKWCRRGLYTLPFVAPPPGDRHAGYSA